MRANKPQSLQLTTRKRKKNISECFHLFLQSHMFMNQSFLQHSQHRMEQSLFSCRWCLHIAVCGELFEVSGFTHIMWDRGNIQTATYFQIINHLMGPTWKHANHRRRGMCRVKNYSLLEYALKLADTHTQKDTFFYIIY